MLQTQCMSLFSQLERMFIFHLRLIALPGDALLSRRGRLSAVLVTSGDHEDVISTHLPRVLGAVSKAIQSFCTVTVAKLCLHSKPELNAYKRLT
jgi:hypothetical protein